MDGLTKSVSSSQPDEAGVSSSMENLINLALLDPPRFGWTAAGGVADLLPPHEVRLSLLVALRETIGICVSDRAYSRFFSAVQRARRKSTKKAFVATKNSRKRDRNEAFSVPNAAPVAPATASAGSTLNGSSGSSSFDYYGATLRVAPAVQLKDPPRNATTTSAASGDSDILEDIDTTTNRCTPQTEKDIDTNITDTAIIRFKALHDDGETLDIYAYHRGREGFEFRDELTGELICDTEPVDTNHAADEPRSMSTVVTIQVPLDHHESSDLHQCYYCEAIHWDLADPDTPNPMLYAAGIAQEFGLTYPQTWDLAESIQTQLQTFVHDNCAFAAPMLIRKGSTERAGFMVPRLYGEVTGFLQQGGTCQPLTQKLKAPPPAPTLRAESFSSSGCRSSTASAGSNKVYCSKLPAKRRSSEKAEELYYHQVRVRLRAASVRDIQAKTSSFARDQQRESFSIQKRNVHFCHLCQEQQSTCCVFACGIANHAYCIQHLSERLGFTCPNSSHELDYCPICSLTCACVECASKLDAVAKQFKAVCLEQQATPESAHFADILRRCRRLRTQNSGNSKLPGKALKSKKCHLAADDHRSAVPKIPQSEFPREVANGIDMDFGFETAYQTLFSFEGSFLVETASPNPDANSARNCTSPAVGEQLPPEDGSVDFCNVCKKVGNLLCCDFCPRAFHSKCISHEASLQDMNKEAQWKCPCCCAEKDGLPGDRIDGSASFVAICTAHKSATTATDNVRHLKLLSVLHEMLLTLMDYDFGYMFRTPVDYCQIPSYKAIVKTPMDLGTISSNMLNGTYYAASLEDEVLAVLKDIELVWHNCCIFNVEGSAVYRMAEVQKRRALEIQHCSFLTLLSERVTRELAAYVSELEKEREDYRQLESTFLQRKPPSAPTPRARHKIAVTARPGPHGRPVAVLDPDTGRVVKIYSTMQSACNAVNFIMNLNKHECEMKQKEVDSLNKMRNTVMLSRKDPGILLYGFRWLALEDLRNGSVSFARPKSTRDMEEAPSLDVDDSAVVGLVEMVNGGNSYFFYSIAEALSFPGLPDTIPDLHIALRSLAVGADFIEVAGQMWRRPKANSGYEGEGLLDGCCKPLIASYPDESYFDVMADADRVKFVKEDLVSGVTILAGFPDVESVYQDWCHVLESSVVQFLGPASLEVFQKYYLDADRNIDGIRWRSVDAKTDDSDAVESSAKLSEPEGDVAAMPSLPGPREESTSISRSTENRNVCVETSSAEVSCANASSVFDLEVIPSPKPADPKSTAATGVVLKGLSENCKLLQKISNGDDDRESIGRGESSVHSPVANKEATAVG